MKKETPLQEEEAVDELVDMIEQLMKNGSGHLTVSEDDLVNGGMEIKTYRSMVCSEGDMACSQPTEFIDEE